MSHNWAFFFLAKAVAIRLSSGNTSKVMYSYYNFDDVGQPEN